VTRPALALSVVLCLSGCATMFEHPYENRVLESIPDGAQFELYRGQESAPIQTGVTPAMLHLKRGAGWFRPMRYRVVVHKDGFEPEDLALPTSVNANYWWNLGMTPIIFGWPVVAMVIVDPLTGAMYDVDLPRAVTLRKSPAPPPQESSQN
jgi:hypothetical protein